MSQYIVIFEKKYVSVKYRFFASKVIMSICI